MTTRTRDGWLDDLDGADAGDGSGGAADMPRSQEARSEAEAAIAAVSSTLVERALPQDHLGFLESARQSGGQ